MVWPASAATGTYVWLVAPEIDVQLLPDRSHCSQGYLKLVGLFDQLPGCSVRVLPCCAVPVIVGRAVFPGGEGATTVVAADLALASPPALVDISSTLMVWPASAATGTYVWLVAPEIDVQLL